MQRLALQIPASLAPADAPAPLALGDQMGAVLAWCRLLSMQHRRMVPMPAAAPRIRALAAGAGEVLEARKMEILFLLDHGPRTRFNQLRRCLGPISTRTLAAKLADLQAKGLVERRILDDTPPRVEYSLTDAGRTFVELLFATFVHLFRAGRGAAASEPAAQPGDLVAGAAA